MATKKKPKASGKRSARGEAQRLGYARVSTAGQNLDSQRDALEAAGCTQVFEDTISGTTKERPGWDGLLGYARAGDTLVITELSRMSRSLLHLLQVVADLEERELGIVSLRENIDTTTATGRLFLSIMGAVSQMERELRAERAAAGRAAARARGRSGGRPRTSSEALEKARRLYESKAMSAAEAAEVAGTSRRALFRYLAKVRDAGSSRSNPEISSAKGTARASKRKRARPTTAAKRSRAKSRTWTVAVRPVPVRVDRVQDPAFVFWVEGDELVGGSFLDKDLSAAQLERSFRHACQHPDEGAPRTPTHVEADTGELAAVLGDVLEDDGIAVTHVVSSPQLEALVDDVFAEMRSLGGGRFRPIRSRVDDEVFRAWFEQLDEQTAARIERLASELQAQSPWNRCPSQGHIRVRVRSRMIEHGWLVMQGRDASWMGFRFFEDQTDWRVYERHESGKAVHGKLRPAWAVELHVSRTSPDDARLLLVASVERDGGPRALVTDPTELELLLGVTEALVSTLRDEPGEFARAWQPFLPPLFYPHEVTLDGQPTSVQIIVPATARLAGDEHPPQFPAQLQPKKKRRRRR